MSHDIKHLLMLAKQHNVEAINELGDLYFKGIDVAQDFHKAFDYYFRAAELGDAHAQYHLGLMYAQGIHIAVDGKKAIRYLLLAAEKNHFQAQYAVATFFREGKLVKQDLQKAFFWYQKAVEENNSDAEYHLGCLYLHGDGTTKDENKAEELFLKSADKIIESKRMLGQIYRNRNDVYQSIDWYEKAAALGDIESSFMLGIFYQMGPEEWQDLSKAAELYATAARAKHAEARTRLERLAKTNKVAKGLLDSLIANEK